MLCFILYMVNIDMCFVYLGLLLEQDYNDYWYIIYELGL